MSPQAYPRMTVEAARAAWRAAPPAAGENNGLAAASAWALLRLYNLAFIPEIQARWHAALPAGPVIIAANHPNVTDAFAAPRVFPGKLSILAQANLFDIPLLGRLLAATGALPVERGCGAALLEAAQRRMAQGYSIFICPEGRLNNGGPLHPGRTGAVRLALKSGAPIVPVAFYVAPRHLRTLARHGNDGELHSGRWQVGGPMLVEIGPAWWPGRELGETPNAPNYQRLTARLMEQIAGLARQAEGRAER